jgi:hypothetical protein
VVLVLLLLLPALFRLIPGPAWRGELRHLMNKKKTRTAVFNEYFYLRIHGIKVFIE